MIPELIASYIVGFKEGYYGEAYYSMLQKKYGRVVVTNNHSTTKETSSTTEETTKNNDFEENIEKVEGEIIEPKKYEIVPINMAKEKAAFNDDNFTIFIQNIQDKLEITNDIELMESRLIISTIYFLIGMISYEQLIERCGSHNDILYCDSLSFQATYKSRFWNGGGGFRILDKKYWDDKNLMPPEPIPFKQICNYKLLANILNTVLGFEDNKNDPVYQMIYNELFDMLDDVSPDVEKREKLSDIASYVPPIQSGKIENLKGEQEDVTVFKNDFLKYEEKLKNMLKGIRHTFGPTGLNSSAYINIYDNNDNFLISYYIDDGGILGGMSVAIWAINPVNGERDGYLTLVDKHPEIIRKAFLDPNYTMSEEEFKLCSKDQFHNGGIYQFIDFSGMEFHLSNITDSDFAQFEINLIKCINLNWAKISKMPKLRFVQFTNINRFTLVSDKKCKLTAKNTNYDIVNGLKIRFNNGSAKVSIFDKQIDLSDFDAIYYNQPSWADPRSSSITTMM